ncbi:MAG: histidine triad nucleotide-binding protein [Actinomycetota bacterium]|jgi:histidine triad (HIT) family protein|nr:histidine triad nucleotide-binding protein [Actinomycetota bacterium]MDP9484270.1 histidine triad nucleotide-binding protein [Actinomycetota bacterium]PLS83011.1 MAG: histidine triad nucleotide-binding protein [Actinomycetota bacterium]
MSDEGCVFCKIVKGEIEAEILRDEDGVLAFRDINGRAPVHVLVIPKEHISSLAEVGNVPDGVAKRIFEVAQGVAEGEGIAESGYAFRINNGPDAGQEVFHLHAHVMGGERVRMP